MTGRVSHTDPHSYARWVTEYDSPHPGDLRRMALWCTGLAERPRISVIMPVYETDPRHLREAIDSVRAQVYVDWQ